MQTWFENMIDKRPLYCGAAYAFTARTDCVSGSIDFVVYNPFKGNRVYDNFDKAREYYASLGN